MSLTNTIARNLLCSKQENKPREQILQENESAGTNFCKKAVCMNKNKH